MTAMATRKNADPKWTCLASGTWVSEDWSMSIERRDGRWKLYVDQRGVKSFDRLREAMAWERDWRAGRVRL